MKRNCTTCKKSNDGSPCDPPERSAAAQWQKDNYDVLCQAMNPVECLDHEPRPVKRVVRMEIEPYVDEKGGAWCYKYNAGTCAAYNGCSIHVDHEMDMSIERPQACIDAEIEDKTVEESCNTCAFKTVDSWMPPCVCCKIVGKGTLSYWSKS